MKECTFRPHVKARQESLSNRGSVQRRTNTDCNSKIRSRDLVQSTGDVFNDLYKLGTQLKRQPKVDRTTEEIEYERNKDKCVFVPNKDRMVHTVETPASDIKVLDNKFV